jgi:ABC-type branched-subunit amino acid transport system ATPase component
MCQRGVQLTRAAGVGIAVTVAAAAAVLLLDEPTARVNSSEVEQAAE